MRRPFFALLLIALLTACSVAPAAPPVPATAVLSEPTTAPATPVPATVAASTVEPSVVPLVTPSASPAAAIDPTIFTREPSVRVVAANEANRTINHKLGEVAVPAQPQRIVVLDESLADSLLALGITPIGSTTYYGIQGFSAHLVDQLGAAENLGQYGSPSIERIVALKPDLILSDSYTAESIYSQLGAIAPTVVFADEYSYPLLRAVARTVGREQQAEQRLLAYEQAAAAARATIAEIVGTKSVALLRIFGNELRVEGGIGYTGPVLWQALGLTPHRLVNLETWNETYSLEQIPVLDADLLLLMPEIDGAEMASKLQSSPLWQTLPAVRNNAVYTLSGYSHWLTYGILANEQALADVVAVLSNGAAQPAQAAFPVAIAHKYGSTTIAAAPTRIVTVGLTEQDVLLALGIIPVGTTEWFGKHPGAIWPWAQEKLNGATPVVVGDATAVNFEQIAALKPDLILALYSGVTQEQYDLLTKIAPTVAQPAGYVDYGIPWQELTQTVGLAVGKAREADLLIAGVEAHFAQVRTAHPEFAGASAVVATPYEGIWVYGPEDVRGRLLTALGFQLPSGLAEVTGTQFGGNLSMERADLLDVDVIIWLDPQDAKGPLGGPLYENLKVHTQGREVMLNSFTSPLGGATSFVSVLSLPFLLDQLVPQLAAAVDGDPATTAPGATDGR